MACSWICKAHPLPAGRLTEQHAPGRSGGRRLQVRNAWSGVDQQAAPCVKHHVPCLRCTLRHRFSYKIVLQFSPTYSSDTRSPHRQCLTHACRRHQTGLPPPCSVPAPASCCMPLGLPALPAARYTPALSGGPGAPPAVCRLLARRHMRWWRSHRHCEACSGASWRVCRHRMHQGLHHASVAASFSEVL